MTYIIEASRLCLLQHEDKKQLHTHTDDNTVHRALTCM